MNNLLPETYLLGLIGLLLVIAILVGRQLLRVRKDEINLIKLEKQVDASNKNSSELYQLASVQLRKRLYPQAIGTLKQALKELKGEPDEAKAIIENAMGFALVAEDNFEAAIKHYESALKAKSDYPVALNNLGFAKQQLKLEDEAYLHYKEALNIDPKNQTAKKQLNRIERRNGGIIPSAVEKKGF